MKSKMLICIICLESALALFFAIGTVRAYAHILPVYPVPRPCVDYTAGLIANITVWTNTSNTSTKNPIGSGTNLFTTCAPLLILPTVSEKSTTKGWATWYSTNSVVADYKMSGQSLPTNGVFPMANGEPLDDNAMTCALWIVGKHGRPLRPDGRLVTIRNVENGATVKVAWADNGPGSVPRSRGVVVDLTPAAMRALAGEDGIKAGRVAVIVEML